MMARKKEIEEPVKIEEKIDNTNPKDRLKETIINAEFDGIKPKKRIRRTKAEINAERQRQEQKELSDTNYEIFAQLMKMLSDRDASKWGLNKVALSEFEPLAKQYAIICNYYMPAGKPIYFIIASATLQSFLMYQNRSKLINAVIERENPNADIQKTNSGEVRFGKEFPSETTIKKV